ncbi:GNAT family N-acetyltransferase [Tautonia rosea]|uniref:GNAT family N-acetyltransferase n=1 Tax=Tautonia rosea TaxID=2728037 RepID=UPI0014755E1B|nr:GNAT family N-acetyltransferase [Tautonia rosea]
MTDWRIEPLAREHDRQAFACGKAPLDEFIRRLVSQYEKRNLGRTYVAVRPGNAAVCGYYTLASGAVPFANFPPDAAKKLPRHPVPVVLLARLAVDKAAQGQGLGEALLIDALGRSLALADAVGIHAVEVDAIDGQAKAFYERYGFVALPDTPSHLFLPIAVIRSVPGLKAFLTRPAGPDEPELTRDPSPMRDVGM